MGEPITSGGLTLDEVLLRFRHPNAGVRREALGGAKEILLQFPKREVGKVCRVLGGAVSDEVSRSFSKSSSSQLKRRRMAVSAKHCWVSLDGT